MTVQSRAQIQAVLWREQRSVWLREVECWRMIFLARMALRRQRWLEWRLEVIRAVRSVEVLAVVWMARTER